MIPAGFTITVHDGPDTYGFEEVTHPDPDVRSAVIDWHLERVARHPHRTHITITPHEGTLT